MCWHDFGSSASSQNILNSLSGAQVPAVVSLPAGGPSVCRLSGAEQRWRLEVEKKLGRGRDGHREAHESNLGKHLTE